MEYGAIDLHTRYCQIRVISESGQVLVDRRVPTERERLAAVFAPYAALRLVIESGTESEWVAQCLEGAGHEVVVVDPNYAPMYGERTRKVKTDRRDAAALAEANRRGWYRAAHRTSPAQRVMKQVLRSRRLCVEMRTSAVSLVRALLRQEGFRLPSGSAEAVPGRVARLAVPASLAATLAPLCEQIVALTHAITAMDTRVDTATAPDAVVARLRSVPGVGLIVATTFRAVIDRVDRFAHAGQVSAALGLVPREDSSAERRHRGHITKAGPPELRSLLVQASWIHWRRQTPGGPLRDWVDQLAARRGKRIAVVALARRLARILFAIWRDGTTFDLRKLATA